MGVIIFNGVSSESLGIQVETFPTYEFPEREYESVSVPGRNGDIYIDKGNYKNVSAKYDLAIGSHEITQPYLAETLVSWLTSPKGYCRLEDSYFPDIYRKAVYKQSGSISNIMNHGGKISVEFDCKPQKFLKSGEAPKTFSASGILNNQTKNNAKPLLVVNGRGTGILNINGRTISIDNLRYTLNSDSGLTSVNIVPSTFMTKASASVNTYAFTCDDFNLTTTVTSEATSPITASVNASTFKTKVDLDQEAEYEFVYATATANVSSYTTSSYISDIAVRNASSFLQTFSTEGNYIFVYGNDTAEVTVTSTSSPAITATVDASTYRQRFSNTGSIEDAYVEKTYSYNSDGNWFDGTYVIELADYGITVSGTPTVNDSIVVRLKANWTNGGSLYSDIFTFSGYPMTSDSITVTVVDNHWVYRKNSVVIIDTGLVLSQYGITVTGTPINGDIIKIVASSKWKLNSSYVTLSEYGMTLYGSAKEDDVITVILAEPITIDCELEDAYTDTINRNHDISLTSGFPYLAPGINNISFTGGITSVEVTPRWWTL